MEVHVTELLKHFHLYYHNHLIHELMGQRWGWLRKEADWCLWNERIKPLAGIIGSYQHGTQIAPFSVLIFRGSSTCFFPRTFFYQIQSYSSRVPEYLANCQPLPKNQGRAILLAISHSRKKKNQVHCSGLCLLRGFSFPQSSRPFLSGAIME